MEQAVTYHAIQTVKISSVIRMEGVMNATTTSMVIIVICPAPITALIRVIDMESVVHVNLGSMDIIAVRAVQRSVQVRVSSKMENVSVAKRRCTVINVILYAQKTVEISVTKTLETVQVVKLDTVALSVQQSVLSHVMGVAVKTLGIAIANLDTGGINVQIHVQITVQMVTVT